MATTRSAIVLPPLPYAENALEPYMSRQTLEYHYGRHHKGYVEKVNNLVSGTQFEDASLAELVAESTGEIFNNAAQVWNHTFFWNCLSPRRQSPDKGVSQALESLGGVPRRPVDGRLDGARPDRVHPDPVGRQLLGARLHELPPPPRRGRVVHAADPGDPLVDGGDEQELAGSP